MSFQPRPHVSAALQHLKRSVLLAALVLGVSLLSQMLVWAVVHFTDVRETRVEGRTDPAPVVVQRADEPRTAATSKPAADGAPRGASGRSLAGARPGTPGAMPPAAARQEDSVDPNVVASGADQLLRGAAGLVQTVGIVSALLLMLLMFQGVVIAGGAAVPGVEMAVTATTWSLVIGLLSLPLSHLLPAAPFGGVFVAYEIVVRDSELFRAGDAGAPGAAAYYAGRVALPVMLLAGLAASVIRFRLGIERGVVVTSVSQIDERLEQELRSRKLQLAQPRAIGALNAAIGDPGHATVTASHAAPAVEAEPEPAGRSRSRPMMRRGGAGG